MTVFDEALVYLFKDEGIKFTDDPDDSGGPTKWGVTQKAYSSYAGRLVTKEEVAALKFEDVKPFYQKEYWEPLHCDEMQVPEIAIALFDCSVLFGVHMGAMFAQQALVACGATVVKVDGVIGKNTLLALNLVESTQFIGSLHHFILQRIRAIVDAHPQNEKFFKGWVNRADRLLTLNTDPSGPAVKIS